MKKRIVPILFLCIIIVLGVCVSIYLLSSPWVRINQASFSVTQVNLVEAENALGAALGMSKKLEETEWNGNKYAFEPGISLDERRKCIQETEKILKKLATNGTLSVNIYTEGTYNYTFVQGDRLFTHLQDWKSPEYVSAVLYSVFGEYCNYGLIYGYANYLCNVIYNIPFNTYEDGWQYSGNPNALDLNILCHRSEFVKDEDIQSIKKISNTFVTDYIRKEGEAEFQKLLENSGDIVQVNDFAKALADFYSANNISYVPSDVLYRLGGCSYDYIVKCEYANMYIEKDWYDRNKDISPLTYEGFLHRNYEDTKQFFTINIEQMGEYQRIFALDTYDNKLNIYFTNHYGNSSCYEISKHAISLTNTASFTHEYVHALTADCVIPEKWAGEGLARYYGYRYDFYGNAMNDAEAKNLPNSTRYRYFHEFRNNIGREIEMAKDFEQIQHITTFVYGYDDPNDGGGYAPGASFIGYLISKLGEEKTIEIICRTHNFGEFTYDELVAEWWSFIQENYSGYTKIK